MFARTHQLLAENRRVLDSWAAVEWQACDPDAVARCAAQLLKDADRLRAIALLAVGEHDRRGGITRDGDRSAEDWLSRQTKSSKDSSNRAARTAKRLRKAPKVARAAAEGRLSSEQADALAGAVTDSNEDEFREREDDLIAAARGSLDDAIETAKRFREDTGETPQQRAERLHAARRASVWADAEGMIQGRQSLAGDDGATFRNVFQSFVDREHRRRHADGRSNAQRRADAAVEMARYAAAALNGEKPTSAPVPTIVAHIELDDLLAGTGCGEDENTGVEISGEAARRLACDAGVVRMITKGRSEVVDVGGRPRTTPPATGRGVPARDGGCTFPGCDAPADWIQVHHVRHWAHLGPTNIDNLAADCRIHHRLVHEGGWRQSIDPDTKHALWHSPDGRTLIGQRRRPPERSAA
jgi:hypothetical protein